MHVDSIDTTLTVGGELPQPESVPNLTIEDHPISSMTLDVDKDDNTASYNVTLAIENGGSVDVTVTNLEANVYLESIGGTDISYEFTATTFSPVDDADTTTIVAGDTVEYELEIKHTNRRVEMAVLDFDAFLSVSISISVYCVYMTHSPTFKSLVV